MNSIAQTIHAYIAMYNAGDVNGLVALFSDDAVIEDPVGTEPKKGRVAIEAFIRHAVSFGVRLEGPECLIVCGDEAAFRFTAFLTEKADQPGLDVIDTIKVDTNGAIARIRAFVDPSRFAEMLS